LQTSGGRLWVLDGATGRKISDIATSRTPWPRPPQAIDQGRICLVTDSGHVTLFDLLAGRPLWTYEIEHSASLTGEAPQVLGSASVLLLLVARNYGAELMRLDLRNGASRWETSVGKEPFDAAAAALDETAVYWTAHGVLHACTLGTGRPLWQAPLTGATGPWRASRTRQHVLTTPVRSRPTGDYSIELFDPKDGELVQRLNFPVTPATAVSTEVVDGVEPALQLFDHGAAVVVRDQAWGLSAAR
jgi:outer membrane protein assembly factor BamB